MRGVENPLDKARLIEATGTRGEVSLNLTTLAAGICQIEPRPLFTHFCDAISNIGIVPVLIRAREDLTSIMLGAYFPIHRRLWIRTNTPILTEFARKSNEETTGTTLPAKLLVRKERGIARSIRAFDPTISAFFCVRFVIEKAGTIGIFDVHFLSSRILF